MNEAQIKSNKKHKRIPLLVSSVLFLAVLAVCALYNRMSITPLESYEIGPGADPARWRFTLTDGTVLRPEDGRLPAVSSDMVVICETDITVDPADKPVLVVSATSSDCVFLLNGEMLYSPSGRYQDGRFSAEPYGHAVSSGQFTIHLTGENDVLTMIAQFQGGENRLSRLPGLTVYPSPIHYISKYTGPMASDAQTAGIYFAIFLFVTGLFFVGLWRESFDFSLVLVALCSLSMALNHTVTYSFETWVFQTPAMVWFCQVLPLCTMEWLLWYHLSGKVRKFLLLIPVLSSATAVVLLILGIGDISWSTYMNIVSAYILPAIILVLLLISAVDAVRGNRWFGRFFRYVGYALPVVLAAWCFSSLTGGVLARNIKDAYSRLTGANHSLYLSVVMLCTLLLILYFIQALVDLINGLSQRDVEIQTMYLREKYAIENMEIMRQSQEETRRQHHELRHHMIALEEMIAGKQDDRALDYMRSLIEREKTIPTGMYSEHVVINAVAGHYLNMAKSEGIRVKTDIQAGSRLPLNDEELCILLTNLLENALEACRGMEAGEDCFISLTLSANEEHIFLICENSTGSSVNIAPGCRMSSSKSDVQNHGYGIPAVRHIVDKHYGMLDVSCQNSCFTVKITL